VYCVITLISRQQESMPGISSTPMIEVPRVDDEKLSDDRLGEIRKFCRLQDEGQSLMRAAMSQMNLSARAYHRTRSVKLGRTIADLAGSDDIQSAHLAEALHLRQTENHDGINSSLD
jgi:predicted ATPase with chaperone activity